MLFLLTGASVFHFRVAVLIFAATRQKKQMQYQDETPEQIAATKSAQDLRAMLLRQVNTINYVGKPPGQFRPYFG